MAATARPTSTNELTQLVNAANTFSVGNIVIYNGAWVLAKADSVADCQGAVIVSIVPSGTQFYVTQTGWVNNLSGLIAGTLYYLSPTSAGNLTSTPPSTIGQVVLPCLVADTATSGYFFGGSGTVITEGGSFLTVGGPSQSIAVGARYTSASSSLVTYTLPAAASPGDTFEILGQGTGLFKIAQNASQQIGIVGSTTTAGTGGSLQAQAQYNWIKVTCLTTNTLFEVTGLTGAYTIV
jgi:hypothetical protein